MSEEEFSLADLGIPRPLERQDLIGQERAGCRLERLLGRGGMGAVYLARRLADGQPVVVKFPSAEVAASPALRERFRREWIALAKLPASPHLISVHDVSDAEGLPLIVMDFVEGVPLTRLLQQRGALPPAQVAQIGRGIALGLAQVHAHGLIHRDVKPDNVMWSGGVAKLIDFGLAKDLFLSALTTSGQLLGTAAYMAPEQWAEGPVVDPRCDLFSLGATLYQLLTGETPFPGEDVHEVADLARAGEFEPPSALVEGVPPALERALCRLLEPDPAWRYPSAASCAEELERILAGSPARVPRLEGPAGRFPLLPGRKFEVGSGPRAALRLPGLGERHALIRRKRRGFSVVDRRSAEGTFLNGRRLGEQPAPFALGDRLRFGAHELRFVDPLTEAAAEPAYRRDVARRPAPALLVEALWSQGHPAAALLCLERLAPDPALAGEAEALQPLLGAPAVQALGARLSALGAGQAAASAQRLEALAQGPRDDSAGWLAWWDQARLGDAPPQAALGGGRPARLRAAQGASLELGERSVVLIGRDPRCDLQLEDPTLGRLHATLLRLDRRWIVRSEGGSLRLAGRPLRYAYLDPGALLELGSQRLVLELAPPAPAGPGEPRRVDPRLYAALVELSHPAVAGACLAQLREARALADAPGALAARVERLAAELAAAAGPLLEAAQAALRAAAQRASQALEALCGARLGPEPAAWEEALRARELGPQVAPRGARWGDADPSG